MNQNAESRWRFVSLMAVALGSLASCVDEEGVLLSAEITLPAVTVASSALVTEVSGAFEIHLSLGERASDPTTVELGTFSLQRGGNVLLNPLEIDTNPEFPVKVGVGSSKQVDVIIAHPEAEAELGDALCDGELQIVGTLTDSLGDDRPVTLTSVPVRPTCE